MTRRRHRNLALGLLLLAVGTTFLLDGLGMRLGNQVARLWPLLLVGFGVYQLALHRAGLPTRLALPERLLLGATLAAGLLGSELHRDTGSAGPRPPPPAPPVRAGIETPREPDPPTLETREIEPVAGGRLVADVTGAEILIHEGDGGKAMYVRLMGTGAETSRALTTRALAGHVELRFAPAEVSGRTRILVEVPAGTALELKQRDGSLETRGSGPVSLTAHGAEVQLAEVKGPVDVEIHNGSLHVVQATGPVSVTASASNIAVHEVRSGLHLRSSYGNLNVSEVRGETHLEASDGYVDVNDVQGRLRVVAPRSRIRLRDVKGAIEVETQEGDLGADDIAGAVSLKASRTALKVADVQGALDIQLDAGSVRLARPSQSVHVKARDGAVLVRDPAGPLVVEAHGSSLRVERARAAIQARIEDGDAALHFAEPAPLELTSRGGNVSLGLGGHGAQLLVRVDGGDIRLGFSGSGAEALPVRRSGPNATLEATLRAGTVPMSIIARQGTVRLFD